MGEVLYPMIKCRPDISAHAILLSQYMNNPGEPHYVALKQLIQNLSVTPDVGTYTLLEDNSAYNTTRGSTTNIAH